jgi:hypothetical protein
MSINKPGKRLLKEKQKWKRLEQYDTLTEAINALHEQGYTEDFNLKAHCIEWSSW